MLEVIRAHSKGWMAKLILTLITVPFALFGIDAYLKDAGAGASVAKVDGATISVQEYRNAMQSLRDRLQKENPKDVGALDSPEVKQSVFQRIWNAIKAIFKHQTTINSLYEDVAAGKFKDRKIQRDCSKYCASRCYDPRSRRFASLPRN